MGGEAMALPLESFLILVLILYVLLVVLLLIAFL